MMRFLAIDPGKTTGWALFDNQGEFIDKGRGPSDDILDNWENDQGELVIIIERYRNRQGGAYTQINAWSENETSQVIGAWKRLARKKNWKVEEQDPSPGLSHGLRFLGVYTEYYDGKGKRKKHVPDDVSAMAHGTYYLRKQRIQK